MICKAILIKRVLTMRCDESRAGPDTQLLDLGGEKDRGTLPASVGSCWQDSPTLCLVVLAMVGKRVVGSGLGNITVGDTPPRPPCPGLRHTSRGRKEASSTQASSLRAASAVPWTMDQVLLLTGMHI